MSTKGCGRFFLFCLEFELFAKIKKRPDFYALTEKSKQNKKIPHMLSQTLVRQKRVQNFSRKY